ncbi:MAG: S8 family serine peptidase [Bryobacteraceae bacterium]
MSALPAFAQFATNRYALILADPPVSARFATREGLATAEALAYRRQVESRQQTVLQELETRGIPVSGSVSTLLNAIFVVAPAERVNELKALPGVAGVVPMRRGKRYLNAATSLMNAPTAWALPTIGGQANGGKGIKIGILDYGIDQNHTALQDSTLAFPPGGFPKCTIGTQPCPDPTLYTNTKVIVARSYVPQLAMDNVTNKANPAAQSQPDDYTPRDRLGHGTAVASTAAGNINANGTVQFSGMAPKAYLGNYKIYGSPGVNDYFGEDVVILALNDAVNDGMDIINFSSGTPALSGPLDTGAICQNTGTTPCDLLATAFENTVKLGVVVVVAAGNSALYNTIGSPADAPSVIAVGATLNSHSFGPSVSVAGPGAPSNLQKIAAQPSDSYPLSTGAATAPLMDVSWIGDGYACNALPANSLNGAFALVLRNLSTDANGCSFYLKAANVQNAGAIGMILYNSPGNPLWTSPYNYIEGTGNYYYPQDSTCVPADGCFAGPLVGISNSDGLTLKQYIDITALYTYQANPVGNPWPLVTIDLNGAEQGPTLGTATNELSGYSSLGPALSAFPCSGCSILKPDLVATGGGDPGVSPDPHDLGAYGYTMMYGFAGMYMATQKLDASGDMYSSNGYIAADGTSFASPLAAGAAALVLQAHRGYTPAQVKSALVNASNAAAVTFDDLGNQVNVQWIGAGLLDAGAAAQATVTATPATVSFGAFRTTDALPTAQAVTITNLGSSAVTLNTSVVGQITAAGATVAVDKTSLSLGAAGSGSASATLNVSLTGSVPAAGSYTGSINLTNGGNVSLHIPYLFMVGSNSVGSTGSVSPAIGAYFEGIAGQDIGAAAVQALDANGVPVTGASVTFCANMSSRTGLCIAGAVTLKSAPGALACTTASSTVLITCPTDNYGFAYVEMVLASNSAGVATSVDILQGGYDWGSMTVYGRQSPTIAAALDAAKGQATLAPGSYVAIYGSGLSDSTKQETTTSLPLSLNGVTVSFDVPSASLSVPGRIIYASPTQVNVQVPWELQGNASAQMKVTLYESEYGGVVTVPMADVSPSFFETSPGVVAALVANTNTFITASNKAQKGQKISLFANGLGPVTNQPASGDPASSTTASPTTNAVTVTIGGQAAASTFAGLAPGYAGLYRIDVTVPAGVASGSQAVVLSVASKTATSNINIQ